MTERQKPSEGVAVSNLETAAQNLHEFYGTIANRSGSMCKRVLHTAKPDTDRIIAMIVLLQVVYHLCRRGINAAAADCGPDLRVYATVSTDLYNETFGFSERPFTLLPDPDFLFWSPAHSRAFAILEYGVMTRAPLTVVTGEVGTGKTTLVQAMLRTLEDDIVVGLISNAQGGRGDLLRWVLNALDVPTDANEDYVALFQKFLDFTIGEYAHGRRVVLIIDEAQNLSAELLEELRMLTNINAGKDELLQLILLGQPELRQMISRPELRQFAQRVSATYHIDPMDLRTTRSYIRHRLAHVGGAGDEFSPAAIKMIHENSDGVPRIVNKLCDLGLVYAASANRRQVSLATVRELIRDGLLIKTQPLPLILTDRLDSPGKAAE